MKVKSTPRFGLVWEFDNKDKCIFVFKLSSDFPSEEQSIIQIHRLFIFLEQTIKNFIKHVIKYNYTALLNFTKPECEIVVKLDYPFGFMLN